MRTKLEIANRIIEVEDGYILARYYERKELGTAGAKRAIQRRCLRLAGQILDGSKTPHAVAKSLYWTRHEIYEFKKWLKEVK